MGCKLCRLRLTEPCPPFAKRIPAWVGWGNSCWASPHACLNTRSLCPSINPAFLLSSVRAFWLRGENTDLNPHHVSGGVGLYSSATRNSASKWMHPHAHRGDLCLARGCLAPDAFSDYHTQGPHLCLIRFPQSVRQHKWTTNTAVLIRRSCQGRIRDTKKGRGGIGPRFQDRERCHTSCGKRELEN